MFLNISTANFFPNTRLSQSSRVQRNGNVNEYVERLGNADPYLAELIKSSKGLRHTQQSLKKYIQDYGISPQGTTKGVFGHVSERYRQILEETSFTDAWSSIEKRPQAEQDALFEARSLRRDNAIPPFSTYLKVLKATGQEGLDNMPVENVLAWLETKITSFSNEIKTRRLNSSKKV